MPEEVYRRSLLQKFFRCAIPRPVSADAGEAAAADLVTIQIEG